MKLFSQHKLIVRTRVLNYRHCLIQYPVGFRGYMLRLFGFPYCLYSGTDIIYPSTWAAQLHSFVIFIVDTKHPANYQHIRSNL